MKTRPTCHLFAASWETRWIQICPPSSNSLGGKIVFRTFLISSEASLLFSTSTGGAPFFNGLTSLPISLRMIGGLKLTSENASILLQLLQTQYQDMSWQTVPFSLTISFHISSENCTKNPYTIVLQLFAVICSDPCHRKKLSSINYLQNVINKW